MFLDIYTTNACNLKCNYCYLEKKDAKATGKTLMKKTLSYFFSSQYKDKRIYCTFIGGEPLLEFKLIKYAVDLSKKLSKKNKKKIFFNLVTNGTLLNDERIDFLRKNNFYIVLSIDGDKETQDKQRVFQNGDSCFRLVQNNLIKLNRCIPNLTARMTVTPASAKNLMRNIEFLISNNIDRMGFVPTYEDDWRKDDLKKFKNELRKIIKLWSQIMTERPNFYIMPLLNYFQTWQNRTFIFHPYMHSCQLNYRKRYSISVEGNIYPCHRFTSLRESKFKLGNIFKDGVEKQAEKNFNNKIQKTKKNIVDYGCSALNYENNKSIQKPLRNYQKFKIIFSEVINDIYKNKKYEELLNHLNSF